MSICAAALSLADPSFAMAKFISPQFGHLAGDPDAPQGFLHLAQTQTDIYSPIPTGREAGC